jgi:hypothetical protein
MSTGNLGDIVIYRRETGEHVAAIVTKVVPSSDRVDLTAFLHGGEMLAVFEAAQGDQPGQWQPKQQSGLNLGPFQ